METGYLVSSAVAIVVGFGTAWMTNWLHNRRIRDEREAERIGALRSYELALADMSEFWYSEAMPGVGKHPQPGERLEKSRIEAYPYLNEFADAEIRGGLFSPDPHFPDGFFAGHIAEHYQGLSKAIEEHILENPKTPKKK